MATALQCPRCGEDNIETAGYELWHKDIMVNDKGKIVSAEPAGSADTRGGLINDGENLHCIECDHTWQLEFATSADHVLIRSSAVMCGYSDPEPDEFGNEHDARYTIELVEGSKPPLYVILDGGAPRESDIYKYDYESACDQRDMLNATD